MTTKKTELSDFVTTEAAACPLEVPRPGRKGCRSWLASLLVGACLTQIVVTTGLWVRPYEWWLTASLGAKYPYPDHIEIKIKWCEIGSLYYDTDSCSS